MLDRPEHTVEEFIINTSRDVLQQVLQNHLDARAAAEPRLAEVPAPIRWYGGGPSRDIPGCWAPPSARSRSPGSPTGHPRCPVCTPPTPDSPCQAAGTPIRCKGSSPGKRDRCPARGPVMHSSDDRPAGGHPAVDADLVLTHLVADGAALLAVVDDTAPRRREKKVHGAGWIHDGCAPSRNKLAFGHRWVVVGIIVRLPFLSRPVCLPVLCRPLAGQRHRFHGGTGRPRLVSGAGHG